MCNEVNYNGYKIYGVTFNGESSEGTRLYNAEGLRFTPSSNIEEGIDDFYAIEDSPFHTRKCIRVIIDGLVSYIFEDTDPEKYNELKKNRIGVRMVAFPKFYYKRRKWIFLVSSEKVPGFEISPMHCKRETINGPLVEYDYVYVSEFMYNSNGDISQPGYFPMTNIPMITFRQLAWYNGMYVEDLSTRMMITILAIIKYANLNVQSVIGNGRSEGDNLARQYDGIKGHDGYGYGTSKTDNSNIKVMDLADFYGNAWEFIEGCYTYKNKVYLNNDIKTIKAYPNKNDYEQLGWKSTDISIPNGRNTDFSSITYDINYPYVLAPSEPNGKVNPFGDKFFHYSGTCCLLAFGGCSWAGSSAGLFCWDSDNRISFANVNMGARFIAFDTPSVLL